MLDGLNGVHVVLWIFVDEDDEEKKNLNENCPAYTNDVRFGNASTVPNFRLENTFFSIPCKDTAFLPACCFYFCSVFWAVCLPENNKRIQKYFPIFFFFHRHPTQPISPLNAYTHTRPATLLFKGKYVRSHGRLLLQELTSRSIMVVGIVRVL